MNTRSEIHTTAIISPSASIGSNVKIGPFCIVGPDVTLGDNVELKSHVVIDGLTNIGEGTVIHPFASIGGKPQDLKYKGERSTVHIGKNNSIREYVTIQPGTEDGGMATYVGDNNLFMVGVHIAHDCKVGNNVVFANYVSLAGHVEVEDYVVIGGLAAVAQKVRVGSGAIIGGVSAVVRDVIPFGMVTSERACLEGLNLVGMKRRGFESTDSLEASQAIEDIFKNNGVWSGRVSKAEEKYKNNQIVQQIITFLKRDSTRAFCQLKK